MPLEPLRLLKNWFTRTTAREENWDEIADKLSGYATRTNNNLKQIGLDIGGSSYDFNNNGIATQTTSLISRIAVVEATQDAIGFRNLGLDLSVAGNVTIVQADGTALSASAPAVISLNSGVTAGEVETRDLTAAQTLTLTGCHWGFGGSGDLADQKLWVLLIDTGSAFILGIDAQGGRQTVTPADAETVTTSVNSIEKVLVTQEPASEYNCIYLGWMKVNFDDTGNPGGEDYWTVQTGVGDVNLGRGEIETRNKTFDGDVSVGGDFAVTGNITGTATFTGTIVF